MENSYTEQNITKFFEGFKSLQNAYHIDKVHQLLNNPNVKVRHKVSSHFKNLKLIIMTSAFIIGALSFLLWLGPKDTDQVNTVSNNKIEQNINTNTPAEINNESTVNTIEPDEIENQQQIVLLNTNEKDNDSKSSNDQIQPSVSEKETIDGNRFILDLTFDELRDLGFHITHYSVFYRNAGALFCSSHDNFGFDYQYDSIPTQKPQKRNFFKVRLELQEDTIPDNTKFFYAVSRGFDRVNREPLETKIYPLDKSNMNFYPVYTSELDGTTNSVFENQDFEMQNDTLLPIVLRFSQLNTGRDKDLIFWFTPTNELFEQLTEKGIHG